MGMDKIMLMTYIAHFTDVLMFTWFSASMLKMRKSKLGLAAGIMVLGLVPIGLSFFLPKAAIFPFTVVGFYLLLELGFVGTLKEKILDYCLGYVAINLAQMLCGSVYGLMGINYQDKIIIFWLTTLVSEFALLFLVSRTWKSIKLVLSSGRTMAFFLLPVSQFLMMLVFVYYFGMEKNGLSIDLAVDYSVPLAFGAVFLLSLIADGLFLDSMNKVAQSIEERERLQTLEMESELTYEYIKNMESDISEMSRYRHDIVNILTAVQLAMETGGEEGRQDALVLVKQMTDEVAGVTGKRYCANSLVNCLLAQKERFLQGKGIACDLRAELPERLGVSELDLCRVLTNLFDNAGESCCRMAESEERCICSNMRINEGYLYITVRNTCPQGEFSLETDKEDKKRHGLGVKIIRQIAQRNNGELIISKEDGAVTATATMEWTEHPSPDNTGEE